MAAKAHIRLDAIKHNLQVLKARSGESKTMAVIKANAYGHGLLPVAGALADADSLAVARLTEAKILRRGGIKSPIVSFGGCSNSAEIAAAANLDITLCIHDEVQLRYLEAHAGPTVDIWLKVDTGMNRLGIRPADVSQSLDRLRRSRSVRNIGIMTHLANADDMADRTTRRVVAQFASLVEGFTGDISIANSAGVLGWPEIGDMLAAARAAGRLWARPGLALYGLSPFAQKNGSDLGLQPAMRLESQLVAVKPLKAGDKVGYGGCWSAVDNTMLGVVACGYGDGYSRQIPSGTPVLVNGRRVSVAGRISMDLCALDLGAGAKDQVGDTVCLWGGGLTVEEVAMHAKTIPYTLVTGITERVERILAA